MEKETDRAVLIKYLLGDLSEEKELEVAERYFEDDDLFEELLDAEDELLDKYVRGKLTTKEEKGFREYLDRHPDGKQKLEFAESLMRVITEQKPQRVLLDRAPQVANVSAGRVTVAAEPVFVKDVSHRLSWWQSLPKAISQKTFHYGFAAALVIMVIGLLAIVSYVQQLRDDNGQLREQLSRLEKEKEALEQEAPLSQTDANGERVRLLEEQLKLEQQVNEAQARQIASLQPTTPVVVSWMLTSALRSTGSPDKVTLPPSARFVSIAMPIESGDQTSSYRAIIQTTAGEQRREQAGLRANKTRKSVSLELLASYFKETSYKLTLVGKDKAGVELALDYYFTVARQ